LVSMITGCPIARQGCMPVIFVLATGGCFFSLLPAQNLVPNPDFETYAPCPVWFPSLPGPLNAAPWSGVVGSADYFNGCAPFPVGVHFNFQGSQEAHSRVGYAGQYFRVDVGTHV